MCHPRRNKVVGEAVDGLGEDLDVALTPPLAVRDVVHARPLLHSDGRRHDIVEEPVRLFLSDASRLAVLDEVSAPIAVAGGFRRRRSERGDRMGSWANGLHKWSGPHCSLGHWGVKAISAFAGMTGEMFDAT